MEYQTFTHQKVLWISHENEKTSVAIVSVMSIVLLLHLGEVIRV